MACTPRCIVGGKFTLLQLVNSYLSSPPSNILNGSVKLTKVFRQTMLSAISSTNVNSIVMGLHYVGDAFILSPLWAPIDNHQFRIEKSRRNLMINCYLTNRTKYYCITTFEALFDQVLADAKSFGVVKGPCLWIYDICLRIGQTLPSPVLPKNYVYLFCGAKAGAAKLGIKAKNYRVAVSVFHSKYADLRVLDAADIEDFLCCYCAKL